MYRKTLTVLWHFNVLIPDKFCISWRYATRHGAKHVAAFIYYFDTVMQGRMWTRLAVANEMFDPWAATYRLVYLCKLDFSLVLQPPCHFSITPQNVLALIPARFFWLIQPPHTNRQNQFSLMKGFSWHKPVETQSWISTEHKTLFRKEIQQILFDILFNTWLMSTLLTSLLLYKRVRLNYEARISRVCLTVTGVTSKCNKRPFASKQHFLVLTSPAGAPSTTALKVLSPTFSMGSWSQSHVPYPCPRCCHLCLRNPCPATLPRPPSSQPSPWKRRARWRRKRRLNPALWLASPTSWHATRAT